MGLHLTPRRHEKLPAVAAVAVPAGSSRRDTKQQQQMTPVATPPQTLQGAAAQVGKCGAAGTASNAALPTLRAAKVPATHFRIRMSTEPLSPREAGRRYLHRGTSGDVSSNGHRRPKFVVTEVRWCIPHANPHEYERPRYQQGRTSNLASGRDTTGPQAVGTEAQAIVGDMDACLAETRPGTPTAQPAFARLLASVGINAISLSNVNAGFDANLLLLSSDFVQKAAALATVFGGGHLPHPVLLVAHDGGRGQPDDRRPLDPAVQERN